MRHLPRPSPSLARPPRRDRMAPEEPSARTVLQQGNQTPHIGGLNAAERELFGRDR